jgi:hypothetical protein
MALEDDDHSVRQLGDFVLFVRDDHDAEAAFRQVPEQRIELFLGTHVDATRRTEGDDDFRVSAQCPREDDLLLIAAAQLADRLFERRRDDIGLTGQFADMIRFLAPVDEPQRTDSTSSPPIVTFSRTPSMPT